MRLSVAYAFTLRTPFTKSTEGDIYQRCWRQHSRYLLFFYLYVIWRHLSGDLLQWERASVFMTRIS